MTSPRKIESNRRNSLKSTGPKTPRGKAASRFNALRLGVFANSRLLPSESITDYNRTVQDLLQDCRATGALQKILADQVVGGFWRLRRIERAEQTHFKEIKLGQLFQFIHALTDDDLHRLNEAYSRGPRGTGTAALNDSSCQSESGGACNHESTTIRAEFRKFEMLRRLANWDSAILDGP